MPNCRFCGKLCPTEQGLNRHIGSTASCKKASQEEFGQYANSIWDDIPQAANPNDAEQQPLEADMPDFHLEEDIQLAEEMFAGEEANLPLLPQQLDEPQPPQPLPQRAMDNRVPNIEEINDRHGDCTRYIENFPEDHLAGATRGNAKHYLNLLRMSEKG
jgi:hypothetical protein